MSKEMIAYCGLYCGACPRLASGKCSGCGTNEKLSWCKIRTCNRERGYSNCSECTLMPFSECKLNHNLISKFFALVFNSDRDACIARIKEAGPETYAREREEAGLHTIRKK